MGGGSSSQHAIVSVFPVYYISGVTDIVTEHDIDLAGKSWKMIVDDLAPSWERQKLKNEQSSHVTWLSDSFYQRLFDVHPASRPLFKNSIRSQGKALIGMLSAAVSLLKNPAQLVPALEGLAVGHAKKGVVASQYGIVGEVLIWALGHVLEENFDDDTKQAWLRIYCLMLKFIIPAAVKEEERLRSRPTEEEREDIVSRRTMYNTKDAGEKLPGLATDTATSSTAATDA